SCPQVRDCVGTGAQPALKNAVFDTPARPVGPVRVVVRRFGSAVSIWPNTQVMHTGVLQVPQLPPPSCDCAGSNRISQPKMRCDVVTGVPTSPTPPMKKFHRT